MERSCLLLSLVVFAALSASAASSATIGETRAGPLQVQAGISGAITYLEPLECYVESVDRSGGVRVLGSTTGLAIGSLVTATGAYDVIDGEPCVKNATITPQTGSATISPFGMPNAAITGPLTWLRVQDYKRMPAPGGWAYEWVRSAGAVNTGLLVKTWGKVNALYYSPVNLASWFYLDDGFSAVSDYGDMGVLVYSDALLTRGDFVSVTGVSSVEPSLDDATRLTRVIRTRSAADVQVEKVATLPQGPFSDEFDGPKLDPRWFLYAGRGTTSSYSLSAEPGWLALTLGPPQPSLYPFLLMALQLTQSAPGGWSCEMKLRPDFVMSEPATTQVVDVVLTQGNALAGPAYQYIARISAAFNGTQWVKTAFPGGIGTGIPMEGDTCYFRIRRPAAAGEMLYCSASFDGLTYSSEVGVKNQSYQFLAIVTHSYFYYPYLPVAFTAKIDYIRFSPLQ